MSRRRSRAHAQTQSPSHARPQAAAAATRPAAVPEVEELDEAAEMHRRAVEMREIRMGQRRQPPAPRRR